MGKVANHPGAVVSLERVPARAAKVFRASPAKDHQARLERALENRARDHRTRVKKTPAIIKSPMTTITIILSTNMTTNLHPAANLRKAAVGSLERVLARVARVHQARAARAHRARAARARRARAARAHRARAARARRARAARALANQARALANQARDQANQARDQANQARDQARAGRVPGTTMTTIAEDITIGSWMKIKTVAVALVA